MKKSFVFSLCAAMTLLAACNESENWTPNTRCTDGDARCDSNKLYTCKDGDWGLGANCADTGKVCGLNAENKPACVSGPKEECVPSCKDGVVTLCDSDGNAMTHQCTDGQVCGLNTKGTPACVTMPQKSCMPYCKNGGIVTCDENMNEVFDECPDNKICEMDENHLPACVGMKSCMPMCANGVLTTCDADMNEVTKSCSDDNKVCGIDENGVPACVDAAKSCMPMCANGVLTTCDAEMNEVTKSCSDDNKVCGVDENGVPACVEAVVCTFGETNILVGTKVCDAEGKVMECQADGTMSEGTACTAGVCTEGECVRRACDDVADGKNVCKDNKLMVCDDGSLVEDTENACGTDTPLCRDGEFECSAYKDCDTIEHGKNGCKDGNIVLCNDGETSVLDGGNCAELSKVCVADVEAEAGYICKDPDPTDCTLDGVTVAKNETICDGNVLKTCSLEKDGVLSDGVDCAAVNNGKPYCDPKLNICRDYYKCGDNDEIEHDSIACNAKGTNKAKCVDGKLVDLTGTDACPEVEHANSICTFDTEATCSFACKTGYFLKNNACEPIVMCDAVKEIYNSSDNICLCNTDAHWAGNAGSCTCKEGTVLVGNICETKAVCENQGQAYIEKANICGCDSVNGWIGDGETCRCPKGLSNRAGVCDYCDASKETLIENTNTCECDGIAGWTGTAGSCVCNESKGWLTTADGCACPTRTAPVDGECVCDSNNGWTGTIDNCTCDTAKHLLWNEEHTACMCDEANGWKKTDRGCGCLIHKYDEKTEEYSCLASTNLLQPGDVITFGWSDIEKYNDNFNETYNADQLQWIVLDVSDKDERGILLLSKEILMTAPYHEDTQGALNWSSTTLYRLLNSPDTGAFYHYFTEAECGEISREYLCPDGEIVWGPLFLLSKSEAEKYMDIEGFVIDNSENSIEKLWWLRTYNNERVCFVDGDEIQHTFADNIFIGVRPAMVIK